MRVKTALTAGLLATAISSVALGASDGVPNATSTGSLDITLTIPHNVRITGMQDLELSFNDEGNITGGTSFCVNDNLNATNRGYSIKATSTNGLDSNFRLKNGTHFLVYDVDYDDDSNASVGGTNLNNAQTNGTEFDSAAATNMGSTCADKNAAIFVTITENDHQSAEAGNYSDTLTLLITAD